MIKTVVRRAVADQDAAKAFEFYQQEAGDDVALRFVDVLEAAVQAIGRRPQAGSPLYAGLLNVPGLRSRRLNGFPFLVFYVEREDCVELWRILHERRDITARLVKPHV